MLKRHEQTISFLSVVALALLLPAILRATNSVTRYFVGAEGRLAAISVDTTRIIGPMTTPWSAVGQGGEGLKTFMDQAAIPIGTIRPKYVRIDHVFDGFGVVTKSGETTTFNWTELDKLVKQIVTAGAVPFFSLSYMPSAVATTDLVSAPVNWNDWSVMVQRIIERYSGEAGISGVYYEVWNEPDVYGSWGVGGEKDYRELYRYAAIGAANASGTREFKFGGPALSKIRQDWLGGFIPFVVENNLRLDFFSWHKTGVDVSSFDDDFASVDTWLGRYPTLARTEKVVSEIKPGGDGKLEAAYEVAVAEKILAGAALGISSPVVGTGGIINDQRLMAMQLLASLGEQRSVIMGEGSWVGAIGARKGNVQQILLTNYDPKEVHSEVVPISFLNLSGRNYQLKKTMLAFGKLIVNSQDIATSESMLQTSIPMTVNSVVLVELEQK
jgi:hypothetical protein